MSEDKQEKKVLQMLGQHLRKIVPRTPPPPPPVQLMIIPQGRIVN